MISHIATIKLFSFKPIEKMTASDDGQYLAFIGNRKLFWTTGAIMEVADDNVNIIRKLKTKRPLVDVSYCCDKFAFVDNKGNVYIYDLDLEWFRISVRNLTPTGINILDNKILFSNEAAIMLFKINDYRRLARKWTATFNGCMISRKPFVFGDYVFVPLHCDYGDDVYRNRFSRYNPQYSKLVILNFQTKKLIRELGVDGEILDIKMCNDRLLIGTEKSVVGFNVIEHNINSISLEEVFIKRIAYEHKPILAFDQDCEFVVMTSQFPPYKMIKVIDVGKYFNNMINMLQLWKKFPSKIVTFELRRNKLFVLLEDSTIRIYQIPFSSLKVFRFNLNKVLRFEDGIDHVPNMETLQLEA